MPLRYLLISALFGPIVLSSFAAILYVSPLSQKPVSPYGTWDTAAHNIQDAVDAATDRDEVVVTNGVYETGGAAVFETLPNRVAVTKPIILRSINGPDYTVIKGKRGGPRNSVRFPSRWCNPQRVHLDEWVCPGFD
jgi:hypothetical protein